MTKKENALTSVQRLEILEQQMELTVQETNARITLLVNEINKQKAINREIVTRINAIVQAGDDGAISNKSVAELLVQQQVKELKTQVEQFVSMGVLAVSNDPVKQGDFIVGYEIDKEGNIINPRTQLGINSLEVAAQLRLIGGVVGTVIEGEENELDFVISEIYTPQEEKEETLEFEDLEPTQGSAEYFDLKK